MHRWHPGELQFPAFPGHLPSACPHLSEGLAQTTPMLRFDLAEEVEPLETIRLLANRSDLVRNSSGSDVTVGSGEFKADFSGVPGNGLVPASA